MYGLQTPANSWAETGLGDKGETSCFPGLCDYFFFLISNLVHSGPDCELGSFHVPFSQSLRGGRLQRPPGEEGPGWKEGDKTPGRMSGRRWGEHDQPLSYLNEPVCWLRPPTFIAWHPAAGHCPCLLFLSSKMGLLGKVFPSCCLKSQWDGWVSVAQKSGGTCARVGKAECKQSKAPPRSSCISSVDARRCRHLVTFAGGSGTACGPQRSWAWVCSAGGMERGPKPNALLVLGT